MTRFKRIIKSRFFSILSVCEKPSLSQFVENRIFIDLFVVVPKIAWSIALFIFYFNQIRWKVLSFSEDFLFEPKKDRSCSRRSRRAQERSLMFQAFPAFYIWPSHFNCAVGPGTSVSHTRVRVCRRYVCGRKWNWIPNPMEPERGLGKNIAKTVIVRNGVKRKRFWKFLPAFSSDFWVQDIDYLCNLAKTNCLS